MAAMQPPGDIKTDLLALAPEHGLLLAAVSGGADSVALTRLLSAAGIPFSIGILDHMLRPEAALEAEFVRTLGSRLGVPVYIDRVDVRRVALQRGWNLEDAARRVRYSFLARTAKQIGATHVVTGHTLDDQAETVLLQLLRGSASLQGMRQVRGRIVRPLLDVPRDDILAFLTELQQEFMTDSSNLDTRFQRSWVRFELLPLLQQRSPGIKRQLATLALLQRDQTDYLKQQARELLTAGTLDTAQLAGKPAALQRQAIVRLLQQAGVPHPFARVEQVRQHLGAPGPLRLTLSPELQLRVAYGEASVIPAPATPAEAPAPVPVTDAGQLPPGVSRTALEQPGLEFRFRRPGDRIKLQGGTKKLSDLLIDRKIPREDRDSLRLLTSGSNVLWVEGVATAAGVAEPGVADAVDAGFMAEALQQARLAAAAGELPVGAVIVRDGAVIARAHNETERTRDPAAHAELLAIRRAAAGLSDWRLTGCTLYVTLEPCPMCFGAMQQAHLPRIVYGAVNRREGALGGVTDLNTLPWKRHMEVAGGVKAPASAKLLSDFFIHRRGQSPSRT
jgi:tRNA(Ile)-lysidine synthase